MKRAKTYWAELLLLAVSVLLNLKFIFSNFGIDAAYQISMSYRVTQGDRLFAQMLEPHQTSAFLCAILIGLYRKIFSTTTGMVLFLQFSGVVIDFAVAYFLYRFIRKEFGNRWAAAVSACLLVLTAPKDVPLPEYTNMQVWFSVCMAISLAKYMYEKKWKWICLASFFLCLTVLAYPSCLILYFVVALFLLRKREFKAYGVLTAICVIAGSLYLAVVILPQGFSSFSENIALMLALETSHGAGLFEKVLGYIRDAGIPICIFFACVGIALAVGVLICKTSRFSGVRFKTIFLYVFYSVSFIWCLFTIIGISVFTRYDYSLFFAQLLFIGILLRKESENKVSVFFDLCVGISVAEFLASALFTNLNLMSLFPMLILGVLASVVTAANAVTAKSERYGSRMQVIAGVALLVLMAFRGGYLIRPLWGHVGSVFDIAGLTKKGPAVGIVSEYMGPYMQNETFDEWQLFIPDGSSVFIIGESLNTLGYLYKDVNIAAPSTISTPGYNEALLRYWEKNPDKYPDVIVASCWYGNFDSVLTPDSYIMNWIETEYHYSYSIDGKYWKYYFR